MANNRLISSLFIESFKLNVMKNLKNATIAFFTILLGKDHVYSCPRIITFSGTHDRLLNLIDDIEDGVDLVAGQEEVTQEAKQILKEAENEN